MTWLKLFTLTRERLNLFCDIFNFLCEQQKRDLLKQLLIKESPETFLRGRSAASTLIEQIKNSHITQYEEFKNEIIKLLGKLFIQYEDIFEEKDGIFSTKSPEKLSKLIKEFIDTLITLPHPVYLRNICQTINESLDSIERTKQLSNKKEAYISVYLITKCVSHLLLEAASSEKFSENPSQQHVFKLISKLIQVLANPTDEVKSKHSDIEFDTLDIVCQENNIEAYLTAIVSTEPEEPKNLIEEIDLTEHPTAIETDNLMLEIDIKSKYLAFTQLFESHQKSFLALARKIAKNSASKQQVDNLVRNIEQLTCNQDDFYEFLQTLSQLIIVAKNHSSFIENIKKYQEKIKAIKLQIDEKTALIQLYHLLNICNK